MTSEVTKALSDFLKLPVYILIGVFACALVVRFWLLGPALEGWPEAWPSQDVVRAIVLAIGLLAAFLLLARALTVVWPTISEAIRVRMLRDKVKALPDSAKAALRVLADGGKNTFYAEPTQEYLLALRNAGFVRVNQADRAARWGLYYLTEDGLEVADFSYKRFHDLLDLPPPKLASIKNSMKSAADKAPG